MNKQRGFTLIELLVTIAIIGVLAVTLIALTANANAGWFTSERKESSSKTETQAAEDNHSRLIKQVPIPQIKDSLERRNVAKRAELFNDGEKISYVYLVSYGKVMSFHTAKGKISSLQSYLNPTDRLVYGDGSKCEGRYHESSPCFTVEAPEIDGTYGSNPEGIFFFTTEGAYVEWNGEYMVSDQPLRLATPPELVREVK